MTIRKCDNQGGLCIDYDDALEGMKIILERNNIKGEPENRIREEVNICPVCVNEKNEPWKSMFEHLNYFPFEVTHENIQLEPKS